MEPRQAEVAKMERERMKLALDDRPVRSELEALNKFHEDRLRATEAELRRLTAELSNRVQVRMYEKSRHCRASGETNGHGAHRC